MYNLRIEPLWTTIGPLEPGATAMHPLITALNNVLTYQPTNSGPFMYLLKYIGNRTWQFPTGLLERVEPTLASTGIQLVRTEARPKLQRGQFEASTFPIRTYQASAIMSLLNAARPGGILQAATGAGKTAMAAKLIQTMRVRTLFVVHTKDLMKQAHDAFRKFLNIEVGQIGDGKDNILPVTVATIQTLAKGRHDDYLRQVELVIFDECHHVAAPTLYTVRGKMADCPLVVGLSASPWRDDGHDLLIEAACGPVRYRVTASDLVQQGYLVAPDIHIYRRQIAPELRTRKAATTLGYAKAYQDIVVRDPARLRLVTRLAKEQLRLGRRLLVLVKHIEHGEALSALIPGSVFVEGSDSVADRAGAFDRFRSGAVQCLIGTSLCDEGVDIPAADALILAGAGASSTRALQRIGRVIRPAPGKSSAYVADIVDEHPVFKRQFYARNKIYQTEALFRSQTIQVPLDQQ